MESWRKTGYVPDSDAEEEFDSQEIHDLATPLSFLPENDSDIGSNLKDQRTLVRNGNEEAKDRGSKSVQSKATATGLEHKNERTDRDTEEEVLTDSHIDLTAVPGPSINLGDLEDDPLQEESSVTPKRSNKPKYTYTKKKNVLPSARLVKSTSLYPQIWDVPSSPDELQFEAHHAHAPLDNPIGDEQDMTVAGEQMELDSTSDDSPLSSPPTVIHPPEGFDSDGSLLPPFREPTRPLRPSEPSVSNGTVSSLPGGVSSLKQLSTPREPPGSQERMLHRQNSPPSESTQNQAAPNMVLDHLEIEIRSINRDLERGRSLRPRTLVQQNPYRAELARYVQMCRDRGIPVDRFSRQFIREQTRNEEDSQEYTDENVLRSDSPAAPSSSHQIRNRASDHHLQTIFVSNNARQVSSFRPHKRPRLSHPTRPEGSEVSQAAQQKRNSRLPPRPFDSNFFNILPNNPESSDSPTESDQTDSLPSSQFQFPPGFVPPTPPREHELNENVPPVLDPIELDNSSEPDSNLQLVTPHQSDWAATPETSPLDESAELRPFKRRIKGVLPASWLALDFKRQEEKSRMEHEKERAKEIRQNREDQKGVAHRISRRSDQPARTFSGAFLPEDALSSEDEPISNTGQRSPSISVNSQVDLFGQLMNQEMDIPEDNRIDYMTPPLSRSRRWHRYSSSKYSRGHDRNPGKSSNSLPPRSGRKRQSRLTDSMGQPTHSRLLSRPPNLGILDAPDIKGRPWREQPAFLRIAARKARSRNDYGRTSPTRKLFQLQTPAATDDVNESLYAWKFGTIRPTRRPPINRESRGSQTTSRVAMSSRGPQRRNVQLRLYPTTHTGTSRNRNAISERAGSESESSAGRRHPRRIPQRIPNQRPGFMVSSLLRRDMRPAQLDLADGISSRQFKSSFERSISWLNQVTHKPRASRASLASNFPLARFLADETPAADPNSPMLPESDDVSTHPPSHVGTRHQKKRVPHRIETPATANVDRKQSLLDTDGDDNVHRNLGEDMALCPPAQEGLLYDIQLLPTTQTIDFDVAPLEQGTFFHESTFLGSGDFSRMLKFSSRHLDKDNGLSIIHVANGTYKWGSWTESVYSGLASLFEAVQDFAEKSLAKSEYFNATAAEENIETYRAIVNYVTDRLYFLDPIDRRQFVDRTITLLSSVKQFHISTDFPIDHGRLRFQLMLGIFNLIFARQIQIIGMDELVDSAKELEAGDLVVTFTKTLLSSVLSERGIFTIKEFLRSNMDLPTRKSGIRDNYFVEAFVLVQIISQNNMSLTHELMQCMSDTLARSIPNEGKSALGLERAWQSVFALLPLYDFDELGIVRLGLRYEKCQDQWLTVKNLLAPVFDVYSAKNSFIPLAIHRYCRALFQRCFHLLTFWGWKHCKPIIETLFDFFAHRLLYNLPMEHVYGSPGFLEELDQGPHLEIEPKDNCFRMFLKIVGIGLQYMTAMTQFYDEKKIRSFVWRLLPNNSRDYPRDQPLRQDSLDSLRNHHDLLCTLYWAVPEKCRPRLKSLRDLVDPATSHKEALITNIKSWLRLVRFKLSTDEDFSQLRPFAEWHSDFVREMLKQYPMGIARVENQKEIRSLLGTALIYMQLALERAKSMDQAGVLFESFQLASFLEMFNPESIQLDSVICQALQIVITCVAIDMRPRARPMLDPSEDSQEFGDWSGFDELLEEESSPQIEYLDKNTRPLLLQFVLRCFGEDHSPSDHVLVKTVDCWISLAHILVKYRMRQWDSYLNPFDGNSWNSLRLTDQKRRFTPYVLTEMMSKDAAVYVECEWNILEMWAGCIVERGSLLKYQHRLTSALLNTKTNNPIFKNLPFSRNVSTNQYDISLTEFAQRRLSMISCVLSNMREHLFELECLSSPSLPTVKGQYHCFVKVLMEEMKTNYQVLSPNNAPITGNYVQFVQRIVSFLQQHAQEICTLDGFFTNPALFPLPADDPTYITAKLKSYSVRLSNFKISKQFITFFQSVSERAAIDGKQDYLVDQLHQAMTGTFEHGDLKRPTIRLFVTHCLLPAYMQVSISEPAGWLISRPLLQAISRSFTLSSFLPDFDPTDMSSVASVCHSLACCMSALQRQACLLLGRPGLLNELRILVMVETFLSVVEEAAVIIDYFWRDNKPVDALVEAVWFFREFAIWAAAYLVNMDAAAAMAPDRPAVSILPCARQPSAFSFASKPLVPPFFDDARQYATTELHAWINDAWTVENGGIGCDSIRYMVRRGRHRVKVPIHWQEVLGQLSGIADKISANAGIEGPQHVKAMFGQVVNGFVGRLEKLWTFQEEIGLRTSEL